ncbi:aminopeptidase [Accumulibacter sp.]|uniref:aminopeptidase n=1 Tax=Accumulibacter sp. TaxID=2053492 RepID=UPI0025CDFD87|nr:aminopeptidase [Accumulibacter sp.]MCM8611252.1 aminopeptidase [Accumulibacter sp.]MCM8635335.1 aminopeptidase [Accumulibacter sp.]MCM8638734.1 aminopeptidase [Accumulibacter sp.]
MRWRHRAAAPRRAAAFLLAAGLAAGVAACHPMGYYGQAIGGHLELMRARTPIDELLRAPTTDPDLRLRLTEVQAIRDYASSDLGLPNNGSYRSYADLGRPYVVWNVFAAPELSLRAKDWCMPIVGCVNYRGYYERRAAEEFAAGLRRDGYDTYVAGVPAYSTLGHFDDPVLNTFLQQGTLAVARTVFHELAHQLVFVPGDTRFNESFATAVEEEGLRRWLHAHGSSEQRAADATQRQRRAAWLALLQSCRQRLAALYASELPAADKRAAKAALLAALGRERSALRAAWGGHAGDERSDDDDLNNARLASLALYSELVPAFEQLLASQDRDLPRFYREVAGLAALAAGDRDAALRALLPPADGGNGAIGAVAGGSEDENRLPVR